MVNLSRNNLNLAHNKGSALIMALIVTTLIALITTTLFYQNHLVNQQIINIRDTRSFINQSSLATAWAQGVLSEQEDNDKTEGAIYLEQAWAQPFQYTFNNGAILTAKLTDLDSKLNLNAWLSSSANNSDNDLDNDLDNEINQQSAELTENQLKVMSQVWQLVTPNTIPENQAQLLSLKASQIVTVNDSSSDSINNSTINYGYQLPQQLLSHFSELNLIEDFNAKSPSLVNNYLGKYLSALPNNNMVFNINTIEPEILAIILDITIPQALSILSYKPFLNKSDIIEIMTIFGMYGNENSTDSQGLIDIFDVSSDNFLLTTEVRHNGQYWRQQSILQRASGQTNVVTTAFGGVW